MKLRVIILLSLAAVISAANEPIAIIRQEQDISPDGSYFLQWESANGITFEERGVQKNAGQKDKEAEEVRGSATWTAPDGQKINLGWLADENGAIFEGSHLPTPPPPPAIPPAIQRALDWIAANPPREERNKV
ncbi:endocuticle structural glycoprotein SgAbd-8 [Linepithema humile]|uniref:endocuticle structural glycoprotein SgAbd-8 n=1 Tax=Linepithema humile TaxID=83485 RepID=UPI0006239B61|nr:PREDICTED: endocuticle structural glycoprotein SgAbd-8-like [Linepithema humile]